MDRELTREEVKCVIRGRSVLVVTENELEVLRATLRSLNHALKSGTTVITLDEGDISSRFDKLHLIRKDGKFPFITCTDGNEARQAFENIIRQGIEGSTLLVDHDMGSKSPRGFALFNELGPYLPPRTARMLYSGFPPKGCSEAISSGKVDLVIEKPSTEIAARVANACLIRARRETSGDMTTK